MVQYRFGILVPWANTAVEAELPFFLRGLASVHSARLVPKVKNTNLDDDFLWGLIHAIPEAWESLSRIQLNALAFCCTSASVFDPRCIAELDAKLSIIPCPRVTAYTALVEHLNTLGARTVLLVTPYPNRITEREALTFLADGFIVENTVSLEMIDDYDKVRPNVLVPATLSAYSGEDAIVISCTGLYTIDAIQEISKTVDRPCLSSNSAIAQSLLDTVSDN